MVQVKITGFFVDEGRQKHKAMSMLAASIGPVEVQRDEIKWSLYKCDEVS